MQIRDYGDGFFDLDFDEALGDIATSDSLRNCVAISLGTDARSRSLKAANVEEARGGWFGDALDEQGTLGGHLYEKYPAKLTGQAVAECENEAKASLKWLVEDGVAKSVAVKGHIDGENVVLDVEIVKPDSEIESFVFKINWEATVGV